MIYCISCKKKTNDKNIKPKITKNNKPYILANCSICKKIKILINLNQNSINQIKGDGILSNLFRNIPILNKIF